MRQDKSLQKKLEPDEIKDIMAYDAQSENQRISAEKRQNYYYCQKFNVMKHEQNSHKIFLICNVCVIAVAFKGVELFFKHNEMHVMVKVY